MASLHGQVALITGAGDGIGAATARLFAAEGAKLGLVGWTAAKVEAVAAETGGLAIPADVAAPGAMAAAVAALEAAHGPVTILVNNAGVIAPIAPLAEAEPEAWGRSIDINLKGVFLGMRAVLPGMLARGAGTILTVSSGAAHRPLEGWSAYCAGKAGAAMLTQACHLEAGGRGIRVMGLSPGTVRTGMQVAIRASGVNPISQLLPEDHIPPDWPGRALLWMCGPEADGHLGEELSLRDEALRARIGLVAGGGR